MVFSSITFLFLFLPIVLAVYYIVPGRAKNIILLIASILFYAWGEPVYVILMILSILLNYFCGQDIEGKSDDPVKAKRSVIFAVVVNVLILTFFKYYGFLLDIECIELCRRKLCQPKGVIPIAAGGIYDHITFGDVPLHKIQGEFCNIFD